ncbi:hypothetical protein HY991_00965 [Candidatus Micrarchaeota archaeon]|nr:hypothetical protein [Candidatus Micrarchaeota archaeon]
MDMASTLLKILNFLPHRIILLNAIIFLFAYLIAIDTHRLRLANTFFLLFVIVFLAGIFLWVLRKAVTSSYAPRLAYNLKYTYRDTLDELRLTLRNNTREAVFLYEEKINRFLQGGELLVKLWRMLAANIADVLVILALLLFGLGAFFLIQHEKRSSDFYVEVAIFLILASTLIKIAKLPTTREGYCLEDY